MASAEIRPTTSWPNRVDSHGEPINDAHEPPVEHDGRHGNHEAGGGGQQRFADTFGEQLGPAHRVRRGDVVERADHAADGAQQAEHRSDRGDAVEHSQVAPQFVDDPFAGVDDRLLDFHSGPAPFFRGRAEHPRDRAAVFLADLDCAVAIELAFFELLQKSRDEWARHDSAAPQANRSLENEHQQNERANQQRQHR